MTDYLPYILGLTSFLGGIYLFLFSFQLYKPKHKTEEQKERYENSFEKFGTLMKVCSVILIINGSYDLITRDPDRYRIGNENKNKNTEWTSEDRAILIKNCMRDAGQTAINYPQITKEYCTCSVDKIMKAMTKDQYEKSLSKPKDEQIKEVLPIFQDCVTELKQRIDSVRNIKNDRNN
ncbi:MAG TPA: hypothetical protein VMV32_11290 [Ignavibacteriaceae bacterium]|nr:hypothetical protein [Ignavibacteriaceae bacterium]